MYDTATGRFLTKDSWQGTDTTPMSYNGWLYVDGNPINYVDPSGQYDRAAAVLYARMNGGNPGSSLPLETGYNNFAQWGSTCTSFASTALWIGGIRDNRQDPFVRAGFPGPAYEVNISYADRNKEISAGLLSDYRPNYWNREYTKGDSPFGDAMPLQLTSWYRTDDLLDFLTSQGFGTLSETFSAPPQFQWGLPNGNVDDEAWLNYLKANRSMIQPGDLVFYQWKERIYSEFRWDHVAVVVGWGPQTYFNMNGQPDIWGTMVSGPFLAGLFNPCSYSNNVKPRVVEQSSSTLLPYSADSYDGRSVDNTENAIGEIAFLHIK